MPEHIAAALTSVLSQSLADMEVIVSDDASPDESVEIVRRVMATDRRVSLIESTQNRGPAAARNAALHVARGEWIAIVDSDDLIHPERFERLLATARDLDADAIADDLLFFSDTPSDAKTLLGDHAGKAPLLVSPEHFVRSAMSDSAVAWLSQAIVPQRGTGSDHLRRERADRRGLRLRVAVPVAGQPLLCGAGATSIFIAVTTARFRTDFRRPTSRR